MKQHVKLFEDFNGGENFELPDDHKPAIKVPKGGSCCANCKYWKGTECGNEYYIKFNDGSGQISAPPDEFCSDWYEPKNEITDNNEEVY